MIERIKIMQYLDGVVACFENQMKGNGHPDEGTRVKHYVYKDTDIDMYWHEVVYLSRTEKPKRTEFEYVTKRKFWGKVRLVKRRYACLPETWLAIAQSVAQIERLEKNAKKQMQEGSWY